MLTNAQIHKISRKLKDLSGCIPNEFVRKPRGLDEICRWKAVEFRQFLIYTGIYALKDIVDDSLYEHFLLLHCAYRILSTKQNYQANINVANDMLDYFVKLFPSIYGEKRVSFNVHSMLHLTEYVEQIGFLNSFSAYPFENYMQKLKKDFRKPTKILEQIYNKNVDKEFILKDKYVGIKKNKCNKIISYTNFEFCLKLKTPDKYSCVDNTPIEIISFNQDGNELFIIGRSFFNCRAFWERKNSGLKYSFILGK